MIDVIHQWIRLNELNKLMGSFFFNFKFVFELMSENRIIFKRIARRGYWSKSNVLCINGLVLTSSRIKWKAFFKFRIIFRIIGRKPKNIQRITRLGSCKLGGGGICADLHVFYYFLLGIYFISYGFPNCVPLFIFVSPIYDARKFCLNVLATNFSII